jgi:Tht1-like fusion protein
LQQDTIFSEAIQLLDSMKSASSCNRIAATRLLTSCQSIDNNADTAKEDSMTLDQVKSLYAARLAICELTGAGATIPPTCSTLYITPDRSAKQDNLGSEALDSSVPTMLHPCLKSLESRPQWWTSYSNSRQNAVVICQAARIELEKEELLNLHRSLTTNTAKLNKALQDTLQSTATQSTKHRAFVEAVDMLGANLFRELEENNSKARTLFSSFIYEIENAIGSTASNIASMIMSAGVDTETLTKVWECGHVQGLGSDLKQEIRNATSEVNNLQCNIRAVYEESILQHAELLEVQRRDSRTNRDLALAVQSSLDSLLMQDMARLSERVNSMDGALVFIIIPLVAWIHPNGI